MILWGSPPLPHLLTQYHPAPHLFPWQAETGCCAEAGDSWWYKRQLSDWSCKKVKDKSQSHCQYHVLNKKNCTALTQHNETIYARFSKFFYSHFWHNIPEIKVLKPTDLLDWSGEGLGGNGSTEKSSSLPWTASILVLAKVNGAVGLAMPIRTGTISDSATLQSSSTAKGSRAWKTRRHFPMGWGMKLLCEGNWEKNETVFVWIHKVF